MRAKDSARLGTLRLQQAALKQKEVDERVTLDDAAVIAIVDKLIKQRRDSIAAFTQAGRQDLADIEAAEVCVIEAFLPNQLDEGETRTLIAAIVAETGAGSIKDMGRVMAVLKERHAASLDMSKASALVKEALSA